MKSYFPVCLMLVVQKSLEVGEVLSVDVSSIIALSGTVNVQVKYTGPMRRVVFGVNFLHILFAFSVILFNFISPAYLLKIYYRKYYSFDTFWL